MSAKKLLKFLIQLVCVMLCLMMAALGMTEGEISQADPSNQEDAAITIGTSESVYPSKTDDKKTIDIVPSESYYPGLPTNDSKGGDTNTPDVPVPSDTGKDDPAGATEKPDDPTPVEPRENTVTNRSSKKDLSTKHGRMTVGGITYLLKDEVITVVKVTKDAMHDGEVVIPSQLENYHGVIRYIYVDAFNDVRSELTSLVLPETVTFIWNNAFVGCEALQTIRFLGNETQWNSFTKWVKLPEGCTVVFNEQ